MKIGDEFEVKTQEYRKQHFRITRLYERFISAIDTNEKKSCLAEAFTANI